MHTVGPWVRWSEENSEGTKVSVCHVSDELKPFEEDNDHICVATARGMTSEIAEANARLISAAPELLVAAKLQVLNFRRQNLSGDFLGDDDHEAWTALEKAIKKATPKS